MIVKQIRSDPEIMKHLEIKPEFGELSVMEQKIILSFGHMTNSQIPDTTLYRITDLSKPIELKDSRSDKVF